MRPRINTFDDKRKAPESQTGVVPLPLQTYGKPVVDKLTVNRIYHKRLHADLSSTTACGSM